MRLVVVLIMNCLSLAAWSQQADLPAPFAGQEEPSTPEEEQPRRYSVEVIVFEYADEASSGEEIFLPEPPPDPPPDDAVLEYVQLPDYRAERAALQNYEDESIEEIQIHGAAEIFMTPDEELTMGDTYDKLVRLDAYRPILHGGWTQTTVDRDLARPIQLRALGDPPLRLNGTLTLYLSRYLHLIVDLALDADEQQPVVPDSYEQGVVYYGDERNRDGYGYSDNPQPAPATIQYKISEDRIFRNGEVRYFDHPKFGVIAKVTRYEQLEPEQPPETGEDFIAPAVQSIESEVGG